MWAETLKEFISQDANRLCIEHAFNKMNDCTPVNATLKLSHDWVKAYIF